MPPARAASRSGLPGDAGGLAAGARIDVGGARRLEVVLWSAHLTAYPYGPYEACF